MNYRRTTICLAFRGITAALTTLPAFVLASVPPPVTNEAPAAGKRVRVTNAEYAGSNVYHTLYLPTDWTPGGKYPVIIEYAPNPWAPAGVDGSVEQTQLGFYQSGGQGFIWATMPFIDTLANPDKNANTWWGTHPAGVVGEDVAADYTKVGLIDILENYGGDPASVFVTGFSRGAIAAGQVGLRNQLVDAWLGFLPHSHHYQLSTINAPSSYPLLNSIAGRASFISAGDAVLDGGYGSSIVGRDALTQLGFANEFREVDGAGHDAFWIQDDASAAGLEVRQDIRDWLADTSANRPGTHSVLGHVSDAAGNPIPGVRIQSGDTHWTYTDQNGDYALPSLIKGARTLTASFPNLTFDNSSRPITISNADLTNQVFVATTVIPEPASCCLLAVAVMLLAAQRRLALTTRWRPIR
ncbi:MAG: carboxypeptidase regulatory-like domain-containing protein [Pirellulales bacterium]